jgi:hypothetical protein
MNRRSSAASLLLALILFWRFHHDHRDVLEAQTELNGPWMEWPGPYKLAPDQDGSFDYIVEIPETAPRLFFRIRREWGEPLIGPAKPDWNTKTNPL